MAVVVVALAVMTTAVVLMMVSVIKNIDTVMVMTALPRSAQVSPE